MLQNTDKWRQKIMSGTCKEISERVLREAVCEKCKYFAKITTGEGIKRICEKDIIPEIAILCDKYDKK